MQITGSQLTPGTVVTLVDGIGTVIATAETFVTDSTSLDALFDLTGVTAGSYFVEISKPGYAPFQYGQPFIVTDGSGGTLVGRILVPYEVKPDREYIGWIEYANTGDGNIAAPLLRLTSVQNVLLGLVQSGQLNTSMPLTATSAEFVGIAFEGAAGILRPGASYRVPFRFLTPATGDQIDFVLEQVAAKRDGDRTGRRSSRVRRRPAPEPKSGMRSGATSRYITRPRPAISGRIADAATLESRRGN